MSARPHLIFDLDGTLVDSASVLIGVINEMLAERGCDRVVTVADARPLLSHGGPALVAGLLAQECGDVTAEVADFRKRYAARATPVESVYEGVAAGLEELADAGFTLAVCSMKPEYLCEKVLDDIDLAHLFSVVVGSSPGVRPKPAPDLMQVALDRLEAEPSNAILIGDSEVDHELAKRTGVSFLFVDYGYAAADWDRRGVNQFSSFPDVVEWLKSRYSATSRRRRVA